jgi:hypothetical protein
MATRKYNKPARTSRTQTKKPNKSAKHFQPIGEVIVDEYPLPGVPLDLPMGGPPFKLFSASDVEPPKGLRYNTGKEPWELLPYDALQQVVRVLQFGVSKYERRNWEKGLSWSETLASMWRHAVAIMRGELLDPDSGLPHVAHLSCNALFLTAFVLRGVGADDRPAHQVSEQAAEIEAAYKNRKW